MNERKTKLFPGRFSPTTLSWKFYYSFRFLTRVLFYFTSMTNLFWGDSSSLSSSRKFLKFHPRPSLCTVPALLRKRFLETPAAFDHCWDADSESWLQLQARSHLQKTAPCLGKAVREWSSGPGLERGHTGGVRTPAGSRTLGFLVTETADPVEFGGDWVDEGAQDLQPPNDRPVRNCQLLDTSWMTHIRGLNWGIRPWHWKCLLLHGYTQDNLSTSSSWTRAWSLRKTDPDWTVINRRSLCPDLR